MTEKIHDKSAQTNRENTTKKVMEAINNLRKSNKSITKSSVAKEAKIERKTLYNRPDLIAMIDETKSLIEDTKVPKKENRGSGKLQQERIIKLREKYKDLRQDYQKLLDQNAGLTELVNKLKQDIVDLEERLYENKTINLVEKKGKSTK